MSQDYSVALVGSSRSRSIEAAEALGVCQALAAGQAPIQQALAGGPGGDSAEISAEARQLEQRPEVALTRHIAALQKNFGRTVEQTGQVGSIEAASRSGLEALNPNRLDPTEVGALRSVTPPTVEGSPAAAAVQVVAGVGASAPSATHRLAR